MHRIAKSAGPVAWAGLVTGFHTNFRMEKLDAHQDLRLLRRAVHNMYPLGNKWGSVGIVREIFPNRQEMGARRPVLDQNVA